MAEETWTVKRILNWIEGYLAQRGDENPRVSSQWLVAEALGISRMQLFIDSARPLTADERNVLRNWTRRRAAGEPLQYITGEVAFRHITVKVRPGVLIPRPETEVLVSEALALLPAAPKPQDELDAELLRRFEELTQQTQDQSDRVQFESAQDKPSLPDESAQDKQALPEDSLLVVDICTGSGCIACSIAFEHPKTRVIATDIAPEAVRLANENVDALKLGKWVSVVQCDLGSGIDPALLGSIDLVVSNPPYVPTEVLAVMPAEVIGNEPALALDGGQDGLDVFRRLLAWCNHALKHGGAFAFELHETCLDQAAEEARNAGFSDVRITADLAGRPRVLTGRRQ